MVKLIRNCLAGAVVVGSGLIVNIAHAQTTLTVSSWLPPKHVIVDQMLTPWAAQVEEATEGRVKIKILPKALGKPPAHFDIARDGLADITYGIHGYQPGRFVLNSTAEVPFLGNDAEDISVAYWRMYDKHLKAANEHRGVKLLGLWTHGPGHIMTTEKQINAISDLKDMKMRIGGGIVKEVTSNFGIVQLFKPAPQVYELLSRGVATGVMFPLEAIDGFKLENTIKYVTRIPGGLYNTSFFMVMNEGKFNSLSDEDKAAIDSVSGEVFSRMAGRAFQAADNEGLEKFHANGGQITDASPEMVAQIQGWVTDIEANWAKKVAKLGLDGGQILYEMKTEIAKLAAE
ncbi:ABC transporter substrate-binding protein [Chromatiales bacterium (ex Bugula neritina AB1)]|nr:ABC transporter substrate-binding protein [Chromatiales bacterium (ex Bugula neritina AB1)]